MPELKLKRMDNPALLVTCARGWEAEARQELRRLLPDAGVRSLFIGGNIIVGLRGDLQEALDAIAGAETYTLSHVTPVELRVEIGPGREWLDVMREAAARLAPVDPDRRFMVDVNRRGQHDFSSRDVVSAIAGVFVSEGRPPVDLENPEQVLSVQVFQSLCYMGVNPAEHLLKKDLKRMRRWAPGERPISRAELKLREALDAFDLKLPADGRALDLGAAPGGWSRVLAEHVGEVVAVDPGDLDERALELEEVTHLRCRAEELDPEQVGRFEVITNDMNLDPHESAELLCEMAPLVRPRGIGIMTIKFTTPRRGWHVKEAVSVLERCYEEIDVSRMPHNALETTAVMRRRG